MLNAFTNLNLTDMETCYKAMRKEVLDSIDLEEDRFGLEPELPAKVAGGGWRIYEVHLLPRPHLRRGQEDRLGRRARRGGDGEKHRAPGSSPGSGGAGPRRFSELAAQLLPFVFGVVVSPALYLVARRLGLSAPVVSVGPALVATSPVHIVHLARVKLFPADGLAAVAKLFVGWQWPNARARFATGRSWAPWASWPWSSPLPPPIAGGLRRCAAGD